MCFRRVDSVWHEAWVELPALPLALRLTELQCEETHAIASKAIGVRGSERHVSIRGHNSVSGRVSAQTDMTICNHVDIH